MLSNVDIIKELGVNIFIYPFKSDNIRGHTINLTASNLAWSLKKGESIVKKVENRDVIEIPEFDTALIETAETIYVSQILGGSYHSKVAKVSMGLGHIGTTLDPGYIGPSLIAMHNISDKPITIDVGDSIISIIFQYLKTESTYKNTNIAGQTSVLHRLGVNLKETEASFLGQEYHSNPEKLLQKMKTSEEYNELDQERIAHQCRIDETEKKTWKFQLSALAKSYILTIIFLIIIIVTIYFIEKNLRAPGATLVVFDKIIDIGFSGIVVAIVIKIGDFLYRRSLSK